MCGIIGYLGAKRNGVEVVVNGLKKLEYRGYDSWGIAIKEQNKIRIHKQVGRIGGFDLKKELPDFASDICIGHTRWATHGGVTEKNAHPHYSCDKHIAVVHNGIIENYQELRRELETLGHKFVSQTDTEVIAHLIEETLKTTPDFTEAIRLSLKRLQGNYAIAVINNKDNYLIGARKGSPLILGLGKDEYFLGSDAPAFIDYTKSVVYLNEGEIVKIDVDGWQVFNISTGDKVKKKTATITWDAEEAQKGGFDHYLIKEINEQPHVLEATCGMSRSDIEKALSMIGKAKDIYIIACGTALHAGMVGQYLFSQVNGLQAHFISAAEFPYFENLLSSKDLVITISQSGETADVMEAVRSTQHQGAKVLALVNVMGSSLMRTADFSIQTKAGPEICVLSTKAYSSQVATLFMLTYALENKIDSARELLKDTSKGLEILLEKKNVAAIQQLAKEINKSSDIYLIGRGLNYPTALEAALKIKEVSYIHAEGFAGGDLKHGPIALIQKGTPAIVFVANDSSEKEILSNAMEIKARGGLIIGIGPKNNEVFDRFIQVADIPEISPLSNIAPAQILSYYLALERGTDPDKPRNLAKSVTVK